MTSTRDAVRDRREEFAFHDDLIYLHEAKRGLTRATVEEISALKNEPDWMLQFRLRAYEHFLKRPMPVWTDGLDRIDFDKIVYYRKPSEREEKSWDDVPDQIKQTFERLGIPEAERKFLSGVGAQYDSEVVYHSVQGGAVQARRRLHGHRPGAHRVPGDLQEVLRHGRAAGGQQVLRAQQRGLVGRLVRVRAQGRGRAAAAAGLLPHQRREHRPVRAHADRGRRGRQRPLHRGLHGAHLRHRVTPRGRGRGRRAGQRSKVRYTTIQNWSNDVYNLVTKRAHAYEDSTVEWIDANTGSRKTVKYPSHLPARPRRHRGHHQVAVAGKGQHQDTGAKAIHLAPDTRSRIVSKSVSKDGGRATYRGHVKVAPGATNVVASVRCDALMLDDLSRSDTYPYIDIQEDDTTLTHEATVGKISQDQVFYLMSRGLTENEAQNLIVQGFLEVFTKELPMEYAIEFNRLVKLEMEGALG